MHASTISEHQTLQHQARELVATWAGTEPMSNVADVADALAVDTAEDDVSALLPYVIDACREAGLLVDG